MSAITISPMELIDSPALISRSRRMGNNKTRFKIMYQGKKYRLYSCCYTMTDILFIKTGRGELTVTVE